MGQVIQSLETVRGIVKWRILSTEEWLKLG